MARSRLLHVPGHEPGQAQGRPDLSLFQQPQFHRPSRQRQGPYAPDVPGHGRRRGHRRPCSRREEILMNSKIEKISGRAVPVVGDAIDTDRIIPARYLKEITFTNMGAYPFYDERYDSDGKLKPHAFNEPRYQGSSLLFVNGNFGCGSSREHAPQSLMRWGIKAMVGESSAEIFAGNCVMLGIPAVTVTPAEAAQLQARAHEDPQA